MFRRLPFDLCFSFNRVPYNNGLHGSFLFHVQSRVYSCEVSGCKRSWRAAKFISTDSMCGRAFMGSQRSAAVPAPLLSPPLVLAT